MQIAWLEERASPVAMLPRRCTTCMPEQTRPKMECLPSSHGVGARVMKNLHSRAQSACVPVHEIANAAMGAGFMQEADKVQLSPIFIFWQYC